MNNNLNEVIEISNLKDMLNKTRELYADNIAYKLRIEENNYKTISHLEARKMIDGLGTALISIGLKDKKIAIIGENRHEWEIAYLAIVCGVGTVVPLDKSLPENELRKLIERSGVEAIVYSGKYEKQLKNMVLEGVGNLHVLISMDTKTHKDEIYSESELIQVGNIQIENGNRQFIDAQINEDEMKIMVFTSGTTSESKVDALSHKN